MKKSYWIGGAEKHRVDFHISWLTGLTTLTFDHKVIFRKPFVLKFEHTVEVGTTEKHILTFGLNMFDYFGQFLYLTVDGQKPTPEMEIHEGGPKPARAVEDAACAFLYVAAVNFIFSVIGTLYVPDLDALTDRLLLLVGGMIYLLFAVKTLSFQKNAMLFGIAFFVIDSIYRQLTFFSIGGIIVRVLILIYLVLGFKYLKLEKQWAH